MAGVGPESRLVRPQILRTEIVNVTVKQEGTYVGIRDERIQGRVQV